MDKILIIYPAIAMFFLTFSMIMVLGFSRFIAIRQHKVSIKFYKTYNEGQQSDRLHLLNRHIQNYFEVPPLFYVGVILTFIVDGVSLPALIFAWLFFILRCLHAYIHLGSNNVSRRFFCFGLSLAALLGLWGVLFAHLLGWM